jgi:hypothetical protein
MTKFFNHDNTEGYTDNQLIELNAIMLAYVVIECPRTDDEIQQIGERVLRGA